MNKKKCLDLKFMTRLGEQNSIFEFKLILIYQLMPGICSNHPILLNNTYTQYFTRFWIAIKFSNGILFEHWFTRCSHLMCTVHWFVFVMILQYSSKLTHIHTHTHISVIMTKTFVFSRANSVDDTRVCVCVQYSWGHLWWSYAWFWIFVRRKCYLIWCGLLGFCI